MKGGPGWIRLLPSRWVIWVATFGPVGTLARAPGTNGSVVGVIFYTLFFHSLGYGWYILWMVLLIYVGIVFCGAAEVLMGKHDPKEIVLDEFVAIPLCFFGTKSIMDAWGVWVVILLGFLLFRFFDILKPLGIKKLQNLKGGLGVVADDLAAAVATCISIQLIFLAWGWGRDYFF